MSLPGLTGIVSCTSKTRSLMLVMSTSSEMVPGYGVSAGAGTGGGRGTGCGPLEACPCAAVTRLKKRARQIAVADRREKTRADKNILQKTSHNTLYQLRSSHLRFVTSAEAAIYSDRDTGSTPFRYAHPGPGRQHL